MGFLFTYSPICRLISSAVGRAGGGVCIWAICGPYRVHRLLSVGIWVPIGSICGPYGVRRLLSVGIWVPIGSICGPMGSVGFSVWVYGCL